MGRKTVALSVDEDVYEAYKKYCAKNHFILSRKIDSFMQEELKKKGESD